MEKLKEEEEKQNEEGTGIIIKKEIVILDNPIVGGTEFYYEVFKALHETNSPQKLKFIYECCGNSGKIYTNVSINIWVCDEIYDNKCINKKKCSEIESPSKENCEKATTSDDVRLKCALNIEGDNKNCREEEKKCLEIINGATEEICMNATTIEENRICVLDKITNSCTEIIKENGGKYNNLSLILFIISFIILCWNGLCLWLIINEIYIYYEIKQI